MADQAASFSESQLMNVPDHLSNNLLWIIGHLSRTTEFLIWKLNGESMKFPDGLDPWFAKGSSPSVWENTEGLAERILEHERLTRPEIIQWYETSDPSAPCPEPYHTSTGLVISTNQDTLEYNLMHEGIHFGQFQIYKKFLKL